MADKVGVAEIDNFTGMVEELLHGAKRITRVAAIAFSSGAPNDLAELLFQSLKAISRGVAADGDQYSEPARLVEVACAGIVNPIRIGQDLFPTIHEGIQHVSYVLAGMTAGEYETDPNGMIPPRIVGEPAELSVVQSRFNHAMARLFGKRDHLQFMVSASARLRVENSITVRFILQNGDIDGKTLMPFETSDRRAPKRIKRRNSERNEFLYNLRMEGKSLPEIIAELKRVSKERGWGAAGSKAGIFEAIDRHCEDNGLEKPRLGD